MSSKPKNTDFFTTICKREMIVSATLFSSLNGTTRNLLRTLRKCWGKKCTQFFLKISLLQKSVSCKPSDTITISTAFMKTSSMSLTSVALLQDLKKNSKKTNLLPLKSKFFTKNHLTLNFSKTRKGKITDTADENSQMKTSSTMILVLLLLKTANTVFITKIHRFPILSKF